MDSQEVSQPSFVGVDRDLRHNPNSAEARHNPQAVASEGEYAQVYDPRTALQDSMRSAVRRRHDLTPT